jgi:hypothetical protein
MAQHATNQVSTIQLPDRKHTQTGKETMKEQFRVHFPDSKLIDDDSDVGRGQQNLDTCKHITNRGDWNVVKHLINQ